LFINPDYQDKTGEQKNTIERTWVANSSGFTQLALREPQRLATQLDLVTL
jgi:hypothetical protein